MQKARIDRKGERLREVLLPMTYTSFGGLIQKTLKVFMFPNRTPCRKTNTVWELALLHPSKKG
jgi:hypothetical protein